MSPLLEQHREEIVALCRKYGVKRLDVFGSAARDDFDPARSDVDFLYEFEDVHPLDYDDRFFGLADDLESLLRRHIDLTHGPSQSNPYLMQSVNRDKITLYAA